MKHILNNYYYYLMFIFHSILVSMDNLSLSFVICLGKYCIRCNFLESFYRIYIMGDRVRIVCFRFRKIRFYRNSLEKFLEDHCILYKMFNLNIIYILEHNLNLNRFFPLIRRIQIHRWDIFLLGCRFYRVFDKKLSNL